MKIQHFDGERADGLLLRFSGEIYNRPLGRGIVLGGAGGVYLDEQFPDGEYEAEIVIRRKGARERLRVATQQITAPDTVQRS